MAAVALMIIFIVVYFIVMGHGSGMLPRTHQRKAEPTSRLVQPAVNAVRAHQIELG